MEDEREDGQKKMHYLKEELAKTKKNSNETVTETSCDERRQIAEMEDKLYENFKKSEETRRASPLQAAKMLAEEKENVDEVQRLASKKMDENMADMEGNTAELRQVACCKMDDMEEKAEKMAPEMRRKTRCMKVETKNVKSEAYECLARERDKVKHE